MVTEMAANFHVYVKIWHKRNAMKTLKTNTAETVPTIANYDHL